MKKKSTKTKKSGKILQSKKKAKKKETYKDDLLEIDKTQEKYNALFEEKLSSKYKEYRNDKEHHFQKQKFIRILLIIITIILVFLLVLTFSR